MKFDAGQFGATIVAEVAPDRVGPMMDRVKQLGKMARLDVQRKQTDSGAGPSTRVDKQNTRVNLSIYNLANVAPRVTSTLNIASEDVEAAYHAIITRVEKAGGRIVTSNLNRQKNDQTTGTVGFEVPSSEDDAIWAERKSAGRAGKV